MAGKNELNSFSLLSHLKIGVSRSREQHERIYSRKVSCFSSLFSWIFSDFLFGITARMEHETRRTASFLLNDSVRRRDKLIGFVCTLRVFIGASHFMLECRTRRRDSERMKLSKHTQSHVCVYIKLKFRIHSKCSREKY